MSGLGQTVTHTCACLWSPTDSKEPSGGRVATLGCTQLELSRKWGGVTPKIRKREPHPSCESANRKLNYFRIASDQLMWKALADLRIRGSSRVGTSGLLCTGSSCERPCWFKDPRLELPRVSFEVYAKDIPKFHGIRRRVVNEMKSEAPHAMPRAWAVPACPDWCKTCCLLHSRS